MTRILPVANSNRQPAYAGPLAVIAFQALLLGVLCCPLLWAFRASAAGPAFKEFDFLQTLTNSSASETNQNPSMQANPAKAAPAGSRAGTNSMDSLDDKYRLAIGDKISFRIEEDEEDPKELTVTDSGDLEVPYLGRFPASGRSCKELAQALKHELEKEYYYRATVVIAVDSKTKSRGKVYLVGAVRVPGPQDIPSDEAFSLSKAVLRAGGFTDFADQRNVKVTRKSDTPGAPEKSFTLNVGDILEKGKIDSDLTLEPGDLIYVPERLVRF